MNLSNLPLLNLRLGYTPAAGTQFSIIKQAGGGSVTGNFDGLPQGSIVTDGNESFERAGLQVTFDDSRHFVGEEVAAHLVGSSPWQSITATVTVPTGARQAVVRIGLNGATGALWIDDVKVTAERR